MIEPARINMLNALAESAGMAVAALDERARCMRIINRWMQFCVTQQAPTETKAVLAKIADEISEGNEHEPIDH